MKRGKVETSLQRKGFRKDQGGNHKRFVYVRLCGEKTNIFTVTSHGAAGKDISSYLVTRMAKQCRVREDTFREIVKCDIGQEEYEEILVNSEIL